MQLPFAHVSAFDGSQVTHAAPPVPQVAGDGLMQLLPEQQPFGHEDELHTHCPFTHCCPAPHAGPTPQAQLPFRQVSAVVGSQITHVSPSVPQVVSDGLLQMSPAQQPFGQVVASQPSAAVRQPACSWNDVLAEGPPASGPGGRQSVTAKLAEVDRPPPVFSASMVMRKLALEACANAAEAETSNRVTSAEIRSQDSCVGVCCIVAFSFCCQTTGQPPDNSLAVIAAAACSGLPSANRH